jgi:uncharacterized protein
MVRIITVNLVMLLALSGCSLCNSKMANLEIIKSTYEGKTSEENGKNLAKYLAGNASVTIFQSVQPCSRV